MTSTFLVDFNGSVNDTGEKDSTSISPVVSGERIGQAVLQRPSEVLRTRTEILRGLVENGLYRADADMKWAITGDAGSMPAVATWTPSTGILTTSSTIRFQPLNGPNADKGESQTYTLGTDCEVTLETTRKDYAVPSANETVIVWREATLGVGVTCTVVSSGLPTAHILTISIRDDSTTTFGNVKTALNAAGAALGAVGLVSPPTYGTGSDATVVTLPEETPDESTSTSETYLFRSSYTREYHDIPAGVFSSFFAIPGNTLTDGDTLLVKFESVAARRSTNGTLTDAELCISSDYPKDIPCAIPLVKRVGDDLYWLDGTVVVGPSTTPIYFGEHQKTVNRITGYAAAASMVANITATSPAPLTDDPYTNSSGILQTVLQTLADKVNKKGSLDAAESVSATWAFAKLPVLGGTTSGLSVIPSGTIPSGTLSYRAVYTEYTLPTGATGHVVSGIQGLFNYAGETSGSDNEAPSSLRYTAYKTSMHQYTSVLATTVSQCPTYYLRRGRPAGGTYDGSITATQEGDYLGEIRFMGVNTLSAAHYSTAAYIRATQGTVAGAGEDELYGNLEIGVSRVSANSTKLVLTGYTQYCQLFANDDVHLTLAPAAAALQTNATRFLNMSTTSGGCIALWNSSTNILYLGATAVSTPQTYLKHSNDQSLLFDSSQSYLKHATDRMLLFGTAVTLSNSSLCKLQLGYNGTYTQYAQLQIDGNTYLRLGAVTGASTESVKLVTKVGLHYYGMDMGSDDANVAVFGTGTTESIADWESCLRVNSDAYAATLRAHPNTHVYLNNNKDHVTSGIARLQGGVVDPDHSGGMGRLSVVVAKTSYDGEFFTTEGVGMRYGDKAIWIDAGGLKTTESLLIVSQPHIPSWLDSATV